MASASSSTSTGVRRSRRIAGLQPGEGSSCLQASNDCDTGLRLSASHRVSEQDEGDSGEHSSDESSVSSYTSTRQSRYLTPRSLSVKGESYCDCPRKGCHPKDMDCNCGEEDEYSEWIWDEASKSQASQLSDDGKTVRFHVDYSCGTAAVRGNKAMTSDQHFWEVKMITPVYGTDMMVGVGTGDVQLDSFRHTFRSLLGHDSDSWGLSYMGLVHHGGEVRQYSTQFGQGSIIGVHLDLWHGTLAFYKNRSSLGIVYRGLNGKKLYPLVSSTAARSGMKVIKACSFTTSLQFMCCQVLRAYIPNHLSVTDTLLLPPGLRSFLMNNLGWLLRPVQCSTETTEHESATDAARPSTSQCPADMYRTVFASRGRKRSAEDSAVSFHNPSTSAATAPLSQVSQDSSTPTGTEQQLNTSRADEVTPLCTKPGTSQGGTVATGSHFDASVNTSDSHCSEVITARESTTEEPSSSRRATGAPPTKKRKLQR